MISQHYQRKICEHMHNLIQIPSVEMNTDKLNSVDILP